MRCGLDISIIVTYLSLGWLEKMDEIEAVSPMSRALSYHSANV